MSMSWRLLSLQ
ncbi:unnamed protein product [Linum tenue]|uniref:Uncharacterized protein n=1 Tax=Linum tenue TaxID=586396 RepID=A0AAV0ICF4_9ROSI|nr:unnamed protein product [Linum tenue]